jgi:hypothetical protein
MKVGDSLQKTIQDHPVLTKEENILVESIAGLTLTDIGYK